jgi:hypothetical protein
LAKFSSRAFLEYKQCLFWWILDETKSLKAFTTLFTILGGELKPFVLVMGVREKARAPHGNG